MNQEQILKVILSPRISEKSTLLAEKAKQYVFKVQKQASKPQIKKAIELLFNVKVDDVRTLMVKGKSKKFKGGTGRRPDWKKAYITLSEGHEIDLMGGQ